MAEKMFTWIGETTWTRSFGTKAPTILEKGQTYKAEDIPAEVLAEWIKTGHAVLVAKKVKEDSNG